MHKISNRIFEIFFKKTLDFLLAGFRYLVVYNMKNQMRHKKVNSNSLFESQYAQSKHRHFVYIAEIRKGTGKTSVFCA